MLPFLVNGNNDVKDIQCSVCNGLDKNLKDLDPRTNKYRVTITFGPLDQNPLGTTGTIKVSEELGGATDRITGYKVYMTDRYGRVQGKQLAQVPALKKGTKTCCNPNEYSVTVAGDQPSALQTMFFMVVPYQNNTANTGAFILPMGPLTNEVTDVSGSGATSILAEIVFTISGAAGITAMMENEETAFIIAQRIIAESTPADITQDMIRIIKITYTSVTGGRRLEDGRRLADHEQKSVKIEFEIFVPNGDSATFEKGDIDTTTFTTRLAETVKEVLEVDIEVSEVEVEVTKTETINDEQPTSAAFPRAKLPSSLMVFIIMLAGKQVLA